MDASTRIIDMTLGELMDAIARQLRAEQDKFFVKIESRLNNENKPLYGLDGICEALGCGKTKAVLLKKSGDLEGGYEQIGKTIYIKDPQLLRDIAAQAEKKRKARITKVNKMAI